MKEVRIQTITHLTANAWAYALQPTEDPVALILSRQKLPVFNETKANVENLSRGAYVLDGTNSTPDVILIATGSEVSLAVNAKTELEKGLPLQVRCSSTQK